MQDKYVADIGDFGKYHLLRWLSENGKRRLGAVWYYSPGDLETNNDGKHVGYLGLNREGDQYVDEPRLRDMDIESTDRNLFGRLRSIVLDSRRSVGAVESDLDAYWGGQTIYVRDELPILENHREEWMGNVIMKTRQCEVLFLDPDNGLAEKAGRDRKHVTHEELKELWGDGARTLVLYHHPSRNGSHDKQIENLMEVILPSLCHQSQIFALRFRRGTSRVYFVIVPKIEAGEWERRLSSFLANWRSSPNCSKSHRESWKEYGALR